MRVVDFGGQFVLVMLAFLVLSTSTPALAERDGADDAADSRIVFSKFRPVGPGSCAARACHGSTEQSLFTNERSRLSHTIWVQSDPHARAGQVLHEDRSKAIIQRLGWKEPAHHAPQCLACHATSTVGNDRIAGEGVSCESCHGPAERWLDAHVSLSWKSKNSETKSREYGMNPLRKLSERAETCVGCHVGAPQDPLRGIPSRDMNHAMIAAGHPRLTYEFAAYLDQLPKHWNEKLAVEDARAKAWLIGQLSTAKAGSELLASRSRLSSQTPNTTPWPEFSEYNCYACHFPLKPEISLRSALKKPEDVGLPAWGSWTTPRLRDLIRANPGQPPKDFEGNLNNLAKSMRFNSTTAEHVQSQASLVGKELGQWLQEVDRIDANPQGLLDGLLREHRRDQGHWNVTDWDDGAQLFLALSALNHPDSLRTGPPRILIPNLDIELKSLRNLLTFPDGKDSPGNFPPSFFEKALIKP